MKTGGCGQVPRTFVGDFSAACLSQRAMRGAALRRRRRLIHGGARAFPMLPLLFAVNPLVIENATYTWTKLLSAFFVILALDLYLGALARRALLIFRRSTAAFRSGTGRRREVRPPGAASL